MVLSITSTLKTIIFLKYNSSTIRKVFDIKYRLLSRVIRVYLNDYKSNLKREYRYYKELYTTYLE